MNEHHEKPLVMLVDDTPENLQVLGNMLGAAGYRSLAAQSGAQALHFLEKAQPDLLLLDILMPEMNGYDLCQRVKAMPRHAQTPVIFISALSETRDILRGFRAGAVDYIAKPFQKEEVLARIGAQLTIIRQRRAIERISMTKDHFFTLVATQLKAPFGQIQDMADQLALKAAKLSPKAQLESFQQLRQAARAGNQLVDNLVIWSKIQTLDFAPQWELCRPAKVAATVFNMLRGEAIAKEITLYDMTLQRAQVLCDADMLQTILFHLVSNAIRFSPHGAEVRLTTDELIDDLKITVADKGRGIPEESLGRLFDLARPLREPDTLGREGSGLGLLISHALARKLNGRLQAESKPGQGSQFSLFLPLKAE